MRDGRCRADRCRGAASADSAASRSAAVNSSGLSLITLAYRKIAPKNSTTSDDQAEHDVLDPTRDAPPCLSSAPVRRARRCIARCRSLERLVRGGSDGFDRSVRRAPSAVRGSVMMAWLTRCDSLAARRTHSRTHSVSRWQPSRERCSWTARLTVMSAVTSPPSAPCPAPPMRSVSRSARPAPCRANSASTAPHSRRTASPARSARRSCCRTVKGRRWSRSASVTSRRRRRCATRPRPSRVRPASAPTSPPTSPRPTASTPRTAARAVTEGVLLADYRYVGQKSDKSAASKLETPVARRRPVRRTRGDARHRPGRRRRPTPPTSPASSPTRPPTC